MTEELNFADADISDTDTMVALMIPKDIGDQIMVAGGVPTEDLHVTVTFHGELDDAAFKTLVDKVRSVASVLSPLSGTIGGLGTFPAQSEKGQPWWVPVDVPGLNALHEDLFEVSGNASTDHGYTPHITLTYAKEGEAPPKPVESIDVAFSSVWVVRGNTERVEIPFGDGTSADSTQSDTLGDSNANVELAEESLDIMDLAERVKSIDDPETRRKVALQVLDLALTKDGRKSFKKQGKWGHGFVPLDAKAKEAKAKGSPIAAKRINRLFGGAKKKAAKDQPPKRLEVERKGGGKTVATTASRLAHAKAPDTKSTQRVKNNQFEKNKVGRGTARARQQWDKIPDAEKTVRNGKRYVITSFNGRTVLTEWAGGKNEVETKNTTKYTSLTSADAMEMSTAELRKILKDPKMGRKAREVAYQALQDKIKTEGKRA